ncbi:MAG: hypothetical protein KAR42_15475 [candidate division Zixibacteria bacterium]|nr:hypothetical protein [candidate division Zixibacteria bacterium]
MIYSHYSEAPWDKERWPNFSPKELACPHCGEYYHNTAFLDAIQYVRTKAGKPIRLNSAHRCWLYNASKHIGGAPMSEHKKIAGDISLDGHDRFKLKELCKEAGFTGFGHYATFLHTDMGRPRWWTSKAGRQLWNLS